MSDSSPNPIPLWLLEEAGRQLGKLVPPEAVSHFLNAQREVVLGITALLEKGNPPPPSTPSRGRRVTTPQVRSRRPRRVIVD
ncbi:MAG: hypothetical protein ABR950_00785 [Candidatus Dormibacteria bacterium]|jgi:hypothetical protein